MILWVLFSTFLLMAIVLFSYAVISFRKKHFLGGFSRILFTVLLLSLALFAAGISIGIRGYQALTQEQLAATVSIEKTAPQRFLAHFIFPSGQQESFELAGDEILVDAHILKWHPWANILGLQTVYQLDRVAGRYTSIEDEQTEQRSVYSLARDNPINLFGISRRVNTRPFLDAQYGSSTFLPVEHNAQYEIRVSTTGLLIRKR
jgi:hypothetical protein